MSQIESRFAEAVMAALAGNTLPLPSVPDAALRIGRICQETGTTAAMVADEVQKDPGIAVRLVRVANSAAQRGGRTVSSVQQAVARLGLDAVRQLVYALSLQQVFLTESRLLAARLRECWTQSVETAALAHLLSERQRQLDPEMALLAGLLHSIGALPIIQLAERFALEDPRALEGVLRALQGSVGQAVLYSWGFPPALVAVPVDALDFARRHPGAPDYADLVSVALLLADRRGPRRHGEVDLPALPAYRALGLDPAKDLLADAEFCARRDERLAWLEA